MGAIKELLSKITEYKEEKRTSQELQEEMQRLTLKLFGTREGQQWLELWKMHIKYDADPFLVWKDNPEYARNMQGLHDSYPRIMDLLKRATKNKDV